MKTMNFHFLFLILLLTAGGVEAQMYQPMSCAELTATADVVVIAKPLSDVETKDILNGDDEKLPVYMGVNTVFRAEVVMKGYIGGEFTFLHFKHSPNYHSWGDEGGLLVKFRLKGLSMKGVSVHEHDNTYTYKNVEMPAPAYLLFLRKRNDGRYEAASRQVETAMSVLEVNSPFPPYGGPMLDDFSNPTWSW